MAFRESDGEFMWQMVRDKLAAGASTIGPTRALLLLPSLKATAFTTFPIAPN